MRTHLSNAAYGVLDYAAYPVGLLLAAPIMLRHLGLAEYGIWTIATAVVNTGGIIASGFGDANIQHIATLRAHQSRLQLKHAVRCMIGINLALGATLAFVGFLAAPYAARHIIPSNSDQRAICLLALRIASALMLVRALESVSISTLRAFERYGAAIRISMIARVLTLVIAAWLAWTGHNVASTMEATAALFLLGTTLQFVYLSRFLGGISFFPSFERNAIRALFGFGVFTWLQAVAGVIFSQVDRLIIGVSLGAAVVASYALCVQLAQPIFGIAAAALHFLFPYLAGRVHTLAKSDMKRTIIRALLCNVLFVSAGAVLLKMFGILLLQKWAGQEIAQAAAPILPGIVLGSALLGLGVTGTYALLAFGRVRVVALLNIASGLAMLLAMLYLLPRFGVQGLVDARLCYGALALPLYLPLFRIFAGNPSRSPFAAQRQVSPQPAVRP